MITFLFQSVHHLQHKLKHDSKIYWLLVGAYLLKWVINFLLKSVLDKELFSTIHIFCSFENILINIFDFSINWQMKSLFLVVIIVLICWLRNEHNKMKLDLDHYLTDFLDTFWKIFLHDTKRSSMCVSTFLEFWRYLEKWLS